MTAILDLARTVLDDTAGWGERAACIGLAHILEDPKQVYEAKALCLGDGAGRPRCPVIDACHTWVIPLRGKNDPGGVCAGRTEEERNDFRAGRANKRRRTPKRAVTPVGQKRCGDCEQVKPTTEFYRRNDSTGFRTYCKPCEVTRAMGRAARRRAAA